MLRLADDATMTDLDDATIKMLIMKCFGKDDVDKVFKGSYIDQDGEAFKTLMTKTFSKEDFKIFKGPHGLSVEEEMALEDALEKRGFDASGLDYRDMRSLLLFNDATMTDLDDTAIKMLLMKRLGEGDFYRIFKGSCIDLTDGTFKMIMMRNFGEDGFNKIFKEAGVEAEIQ